MRTEGFAQSEGLQLGEILVSCVSLVQAKQDNSRTGVPKPVTASQPFFAGNPSVSQPLDDPLRISVNALYPLEYSQGLRKPKTGLPAATRASLTRAMIAATVGQDAEVPSTRVG